MKESRKRKDYIVGNKSGAYITNLPISELRKNGIKVSYVFTIEEYVEYMKGNNIIPSGKGLWDIMYTISKNYRDLNDFTRLGPPLEEKSMSKSKEDTIVYLKEGIKVIAENGDVYEVEDGDYVVINNQIRQGPILNTDILKSIDNDDNLEAILDLMEVHSEHYIINQLITGMNIELEHTDDIYIALNIAVDHVIEIPDYYTRLIDMERKAKNSSFSEKSLEIKEGMKQKWLYDGLDAEIGVSDKKGNIIYKKVNIKYDENRNNNEEQGKELIKGLVDSFTKKGFTVVSSTYKVNHKKGYSY